MLPNSPNVFLAGAYAADGYGLAVELYGAFAETLAQGGQGVFADRLALFIGEGGEERDEATTGSR